MRKLITLLLLSLIQVSLLGCSSQNYVKPDLGMTSRLAGKAYTEGRCDDAIPHYIDIIKEFPQDTDSRLRIANCLYLTGDVSGAVEEYKIILRSDPAHSSAWYNLSYIQIEELAKTLKGVVDAPSSETAEEQLMVTKARELLQTYKKSTMNTEFSR